MQQASRGFLDAAPAAAAGRNYNRLKIFSLEFSLYCPSLPRLRQRMLLPSSSALATETVDPLGSNAVRSIPATFQQHRTYGTSFTLFSKGLLKAGQTQRRQGILLEQQNQYRKLLYRPAGTTTGTGNSGQRNSRWRVSTVFLFLPCVATFGLGTWQLFRRQWKVELLDYRRKRLDEKPIPLMNALAEAQKAIEMRDQSSPLSGHFATNELEFRTVICEGEYDTDRNIYVGPRARTVFGATQKGYFVITPLLGPDESLQVSVLVNRGWVPSEWVEQSSLAPSNEQEGEVSKKTRMPPWWKFWSRRHQTYLESKDHLSTRRQATTVKVHGVIRDSEQPNAFVPLNVPGAGQWFYVDVPAMAHYLGLSDSTVLVEAVQEPEKSGGKDIFPIAKDPDALLHSSVMPRDHINYALTWYTLSAATTFMAVKRVFGLKKGS